MKKYKKVTCKEHGKKPCVIFELEDKVIAKYCFECFAFSFQKQGMKNYVKKLK